MNHIEQTAESASTTKKGPLATLRGVLGLSGTGTRSSGATRLVLPAVVALAGFALSAPSALGSTPETPEAVAATAVTSTSATLNGVLNPLAAGFAGSFQFSYAPSEAATCAGVSIAPESPALAFGAEKEAVSAPVLGLQPNTEYAVCLTAFSLSAEPSSPSAAVSFKTAAAAPSIDAESASAVSSTAAILEAQVNPNNEETTYSFEYSTKQKAGVLEGTIVKGAGAGPLEGFGDQTASAPTDALLPDTTYFYRVVAKNVTGTTDGTVSGFTTVATPKTAAATSVTATTATFNGTLTPLNATVAAEYSFAYNLGTECAGASVTTPESAGTGSGAKAVSTAVTGLQPSSTYSVCLVSSNAAGSETDSATPQITFKTSAAAPTVNAESVSNLTPFKATLEAQINPNSQATTYSFEYATEVAKIGTPAATTIRGGSALGGFGDQTASAPTGHVLTPATTYFYRVIAENATHETTEGKVEEFATPAATAPVIESESSSQVTAEHVRLEAAVNPESQDTTCVFEYATEETQLGKPAATTVPCTTPLGTSANNVPTSLDISGLKPATTYYYRVVATNATGPTQGVIEHFETLTAQAPKIEEPSITNVTDTAATLNAQVNPGSLKTTYTFELAPAGGTFTAVSEPEGAGALPEGTEAIPLSVHIQHGLIPNTSYQFRLTAHNTIETATSEPVPFITQRTGTTPTLPDNRQWEMVTPANKRGTLFYAFQGGGLDFTPVIQASINGDAIVDQASQPTEAEPQGYSNEVQVLSTRSATGWSSQSLQPPRAEAAGPGPSTGLPQEYGFFSADLSHGVLDPLGNFFALSPFASEATPYLRTNYINGNVSERCEGSYLSASSCYQPLLSGCPAAPKECAPIVEEHADVPPGTEFGEELRGQCKHARVCGPTFFDATPDLSHGVLSACPLVRGALNTECAEDGRIGHPFYEWSDGRLQPLPAELAGLEQFEDSLAGRQHAISINGQRVLLQSSSEESATLYLRENSTRPESPLTSGGVGSGTLIAGSPEVTELETATGEGNLSAGSTEVTGFTSDGQFVVGQSIVGPGGVGIAPGTTIIAISGETLTLSAPATATLLAHVSSDGPAPFAVGQRITDPGNLPEGDTITAVAAGKLTLSAPASNSVGAARLHAGQECIEPAGACSIELGTGQFDTASADDSRVFFTAYPSRDLVEYDLNAEAGHRLTDVTGGVGVSHVLGASEDGSYVYFTAAGALPGTGAAPSTCINETSASESEREAATCNVYLRHDGVTRLIGPGGPVGHEGRVSPDGHWLAFMSDRDLTGYDTRDASSGHLDQEVYLYDADTGRLVCASCDPTGARPVGFFNQLPLARLLGVSAQLLERAVAASVPEWHEYRPAEYQARYLSDGGRLFFNSDSALVPQDINGAEDVYEYEPEGFANAEGQPQCTSASDTFSEHSAGCVSLISSGTAAQNAVFLDASESGSDVFFLTAAKLAPQDVDSAPDVYDAHECTSASPCTPTPTAEPLPCITEASCKPAPATQPTIFGASGSATFSGPGNTTPPPPPPPAKLTPAEIRAKHLASALKACRKDKNRKKRATCEKAARRAFGARAAAKKSPNKPTNDRRASR